jgi:hypothetical protein
MRKSRYTTIQTPSWPCPYCGCVHYARDLVWLENERLECCQCGQAFTPAKAADSRSIGFRDSAGQVKLICVNASRRNLISQSKGRKQ